jgi:hypothetical protein
MIDTSSLSRILSVDVERMTLLVELTVPMDYLVEASPQRGLIPPVVMEFLVITVGGGFVGTSLEGGSYKSVRTSESESIYCAIDSILKVREEIMGCLKDLFVGIAASLMDYKLC